MRDFFKTFLIIVFVTFLLMFLLDKVYTYIFENGEPRSKIQNMLKLKNKHYDVAFFGSSRIENHIDCKLISELTGKSCVNFGVSGGSPGDMLILMKLAKNRKVSFDQVFMQVDYNFNSAGITDYFKANLVPFIGDPTVKEQLQKYSKDYIYGTIPFYRYLEFDKVVGLRELSASFLRRKPNYNLESGYSPKQGIGNVISGRFPEKINFRSQELDEMKDFYENTNTTLVFITAPYCKAIKNRDFMDKVQMKLPLLHNYIDIFDDKDEYFFNCGHLNGFGAEVFTKILIGDFLN